MHFTFIDKTFLNVLREFSIVVGVISIHKAIPAKATKCARKWRIMHSVARLVVVWEHCLDDRETVMKGVCCLGFKKESGARCGEQGFYKPKRKS